MVAVHTVFLLYLKPTVGMISTENVERAYENPSFRPSTVGMMVL